MMALDDMVAPFREEFTDRNCRDERNRHRFFFLNGILCRTENSDGSFRPADVFVGRDPPPRGTAMLGESSRIFDDSAVAPSFADVDRDCSIFNTFGVFSGGVLIDPNTRCFVDFVDDIVVTPTLCKEEANGNVPHYKSLEYANIRGEGVMCLCSSIEPLNLAGKRDTPLSWPRSMRLTGSTEARFLALRNVDRILRRCLTEVSANRKMFRLVEGYRCHIKSKRPPQSFMTQNIPFIFQYGGRPFLLQDDSDEKEENRSFPTPGPLFSEFHAFTGLPKMVRMKTGEVGTFNHGVEFGLRLEKRLQSMLKPLRKNLFIGRRVLRDKPMTRMRKYWYTFWRYFKIFRVYPAPSPNADGRSEWHLADDRHVNYEKAVLEFEEARRKYGNSEWDRTAVVDAWDWLIVHERHSFLRRLAKVERCLDKIQL
ncbi:hypothetical protein TCDM_07640 [Trypanosoma cruzi Dm28c]|uniref:Uncharacterized protein n=1 Tax=Trypanosoma cruzi Dm28c TaxID=1416333 RepID=V5DA38_TRYCR|nr:hypothetical protein TCDM_07640 [Trypanosoma cruzi Dm28c]PBJ79170.1 hypothetical protein BCY84_03120 [Trypanosoma cruzi cruzi]